MVWLGFILSVLAAIFTNPVMLATCIVVFLFLSIDGLFFRSSVTAAAEALRVVGKPPELATSVGRPVSVITTITNESERSFNVLDTRLILPLGLSEKQSPKSSGYLLNHRGQLSFESQIEPTHVGNFTVSQLHVTLASSRSLFVDDVAVRPMICIAVKPAAAQVTEPIETDTLLDLARDESRHGIGTDLAGLRLATFLDNYRLLDWRAVARYGKLMTYDFYLEKEPAIMLLVDLSLLTGFFGRVMLQELHSIVTNIREATPLGLILYKPGSVVTTILSSVGNKERILRVLLENHDIMQASQNRIGPEVEYASEVDSLSKLAEFDSAPKASLKRLALFARVILPFYEHAEAKHSYQPGGPSAFRRIRLLADPLLVIAIADEGSNVEGLVEGARRAALLNHKVLLILVSAIIDEHFHRLPVRESYGVSVVKSSPRNLVHTVNAEILALISTRNVRAYG